MEGHQRNLYLYDRFNARVAGVSRDDAETLKVWGEHLGVTFPLLSNPVGHLGEAVGVLAEGAPMFARRTLIIDKWGTIRYARDGSPDFREILLMLRDLHNEERSR